MLKSQITKNTSLVVVCVTGAVVVVTNAVVAAVVVIVVVAAIVAADRSDGGRVGGRVYTVRISVTGPVGIVVVGGSGCCYCRCW